MAKENRRTRLVPALPSQSTGRDRVGLQVAKHMGRWHASLVACHPMWFRVHDDPEARTRYRKLWARRHAVFCSDLPALQSSPLPPQCRCSSVDDRRLKIPPCVMLNMHVCMSVCLSVCLYVCIAAACQPTVAQALPTASPMQTGISAVYASLLATPQPPHWAGTRNCVFIDRHMSCKVHVGRKTSSSIPSMRSHHINPRKREDTCTMMMTMMIRSIGIPTLRKVGSGLSFA